MTRAEIHARLTETVEAEWYAYRSAMLQLPSICVFAKAHEIHAARTCYEELVLNAGAYSAEQLAYLLTLPAPLETVREQWMKQENEDLEAILSRVLRSVQAQEPEQEHGFKTEE